MLESRGAVAVQSVVVSLVRASWALLSRTQSLLGAYETLFVERCTSCERVLSAEGHVPPVVRVWGDGKWTARHAGCRI